MNRRKFVKVVPSLAFLAGPASGLSMQLADLQELKPIVLPKPDKEFRLKPAQRVLFAQTVGYPQ
jgi:hypothetical protein